MKTFLLELQYALLITASTTVGSSRGLANNNIVPPSPSTPTTTTTTMIETTTAKNILYDIPISNNGARARIILYKKEIPPSECTILSPMDIFGGLKSDDYLKINPQGKVPSLICPTNNGLSIAESDTICRYLLHTYAHIGPSFQPDNPLSNMIARFHDMCLTTIQSCLYRASPPFGPYHCRKSALQEYSKQLYIIEKVLINAIDSKSSSSCSSSSSSSGPYLCGEQISLADATLFPSIVFATYMFPKFSGGGGGATPPGILFDDDDDSSSSSTRPPIPRKIQDWFQTMIDTDTAFNSVYKEVRTFVSLDIVISCMLRSLRGALLYCTVLGT
jgi:glutathione S-transferase